MLEGTCDPSFQAVADAFDAQLAEGGGGAAAVYYRGRPVVDVWAGIADEASGRRWREDTTVVSFSTTKGVTATALHICADRGLIDYDDRVAEHWPDFAANGKADITVRQVLCHEAGLYDVLSMIDRREQLLDWDAMVAALEGAAPAYEPGTANAYHAVTFGFLVGELVRRVSGRGISEFVADEIAAPLELDGAYVGTPDDALDRVATLIRPEDVGVLDEGSEGSGGSAEPSQLQAYAESLGVEFRPDVIRAALGLPTIGDLLFRRDALRYPIPAVNGTFTARSLARIYAALAAGGTLDGVKLMSTETRDRAIEVQNDRPDLVIIFPMHWRLGYHGVFTTAGIPERGFGHFGLGGSGAWADPDRDLAVAMVVNRMGIGLAGDDRLMAVGGEAMRSADAIAAEA